MRRPSYLIRRGGRYFLRLRVPDCLQSALGLKEIRRALGTADPRRARVLAATKAGSILAAMERARVAGDDGTGEDIKEALRLAVETAEVADALAAVAGENRRLQGNILTLKEAIHHHEVARIEGERRAATMVAAQAIAAMTPADPLANLHPQARRPWWELIDTFFHERPQTDANRANYMREFVRMAATINKTKPLGTVTFDDLDGHHDALLLVAKPRSGNDVLSAKAQDRCLSHVKTFFNWAYGKGWLTCDPSAALRAKGLRKRQIAEKKRRPFTPAELDTLFHSPLFVGCRNADRLKEAGSYVYRGGRYWLPLLALWTGGRLTELTRLQCRNISEQSGIWYADLANIPDGAEGDESEAKPTDGDGGKTENSRRLAPLHPDFLALGFLEFVAFRRRVGGGDDALLFDEVADHGRFYNDDWQERGRPVKGVFATIGIKNRKTSFHSLRHSFADMIRTGGRAGMDSRLQDRLMGHAPSGAARHYGSPLTPEEAAAFLAVRAPTDLTHLLPSPERPAVPTKMRPTVKTRQPTTTPRKRVLVPPRRHS